MTAPLHARFLESTRGRIVELLRRAGHTVDDLSRALGLTDNAVRLHLATLERDGLVRQDGVRRGPGAGKPATLYELDPAAEPLLSRAYVPMLVALLEELGGRMKRSEMDALMRDVGRRIAATQPAAAGAGLDDRVRAAAGLLEALGASATLERDGTGYVIRGAGCPLSAAVTRRAEVCRALEALLAELTGAPVREACNRDERPCCRFEIGA